MSGPFPGPCRRPVAAGRDRHRGHAARDEGRLLVRAEREAEVDELAERARPAGLAPRLGGELGPDRLHEARRRRPRRIAGELEARHAVARDRVEVDDGDDVLALGRVGGELGRAEPADGPAVGGQEEERVRERQARRPAGRRVCPRELDEDGRAGGVVVRARAGAAVVAVGEDDDRLVREPGLLGDEVHERDPPASRDLGGEPLPRDLVAVRRELAREPPARPRLRRWCPARAWGPSSARSAATARGVARVEGGRDVRRLERRRPRDAEGENEERQPDEEPRAAVEAPVDGPVERAGTRAAPRRRRRNGSHRRSIVGRGFGRPPVSP